MVMERLVEVCAGNMGSVEAAVQGGAERIELCAALALDGLTPSMGMLQLVRERFPKLTIHVLVRPREGNFVYSDAELAVMERDMAALMPWADGFVAGVLTAAGDIDVPATRRLLMAAQGKPFTFHRAFDVCRHPEMALEQLIDLGCQRVLTSGQQSTAEQGLDLLRTLCTQAHRRIIVMPGGGVNASNARHILDHLDTNEIHASASAGTGVTQIDEVRKIVQSLR